MGGGKMGEAEKRGGEDRKREKEDETKKEAQ